MFLFDFCCVQTQTSENTILQEKCRILDKQHRDGTDSDQTALKEMKALKRGLEESAGFFESQKIMQVKDRMVEMKNEHEKQQTRLKASFAENITLLEEALQIQKKESTIQIQTLNLELTRFKERLKHEDDKLKHTLEDNAHYHKDNLNLRRQRAQQETVVEKLRVELVESQQVSQNVDRIRALREELVAAAAEFGQH